MKTIARRSHTPLYESVANHLVRMMDSGALAVGSRAPSVRR